jgi:hypothetical protein
MLTAELGQTRAAPPVLPIARRPLYAVSDQTCAALQYVATCHKPTSGDGQLPLSSLPPSLKPHCGGEPAMARQNTCVLSQNPVIVLGTIREAVETRFFCLEATSLPCTSW